MKNEDDITSQCPDYIEDDFSHCKKYTTGECTHATCPVQVALEIEPITIELDEIPEDTPRLDLWRKLEPVFKDLANLPELESDSIIEEMIGPRFDLKRVEIKKIEKRIGSLRRERRKQIKPTRQREQSEENEKGPAQNRKGTMSQSQLQKFEGRLVDIVLVNNSPMLLLKKEKGSHELQQCPYSQAQIPWRIPRFEEIIRHRDLWKQDKIRWMRTLWQAYNNEQRTNFLLTKPEYYEYSTSFVISSYFYEFFNISPIDEMEGDPEMGKTRRMRTVIEASYHGFCTEQIREASLIRQASELKVTVGFDLEDAYSTAIRGNSMDLLLARFEKGAKISRVLDPFVGTCEGIRTYEVYGPTCIATNKAIPPSPLRSRCIPVSLAKGEFSNELDMDKLIAFREAFSVLRADFLINERQFPEVEKPATGRLGDLLRPLLTVVRFFNPEEEEALMRVARFLEEEKHDAFSETSPVRVLKAVIHARSHVRNGCIPVSEIATSAGLSAKKVARELWRMGFARGPSTSTGGTSMVYDESNIRRLCPLFGLDFNGRVAGNTATPSRSQTGTIL